jgi:hypothetical protein
VLTRLGQFLIAKERVQGVPGGEAEASRLRAAVQFIMYHAR